jgi:cytoskeletal protein RodZ
VLSPLAGALRLASLLLCLVVSVSFALFVIDRTGSASAHQQAELNHPASAPPVGQTQPGEKTSSAPSKGSARKKIDEIAKDVTSPFSGVTESWHSEWLRRIVILLLTLAIYGFGLSFIARWLRVRA